MSSATFLYSDNHAILYLEFRKGDIMDYNDYKKSRDIAWQILIREQVSELPVSVSRICHNMRIPIKLYDSDDDNSGYSILTKSGPVIFVKAYEPSTRQRFTVAHELGHILLNHVGIYFLVNREPSKTDNPIEQAANVFASRLLAPACVLWGLNVRDSKMIAELCQISEQSAEFRQQRMEVLYERNAFLKSPLECKVYENFKEYIEKHRL